MCCDFDQQSWLRTRWKRVYEKSNTDRLLKQISNIVLRSLEIALQVQTTAEPTLHALIR